VAGSRSCSSRSCRQCVILASPRGPNLVPSTGLLFLIRSRHLPRPVLKGVVDEKNIATCSLQHGGGSGGTGAASTVWWRSTEEARVGQQEWIRRTRPRLGVWPRWKNCGVFHSPRSTRGLRRALCRRHCPRRAPARPVENQAEGGIDRRCGRGSGQKGPSGLRCRPPTPGVPSFLLVRPLFKKCSLWSLPQPAQVASGQSAVVGLIRQGGAPMLAFRHHAALRHRPI